MSEEQFDNLRKLLALKRHEQPPPGYFERLSEQIHASIRSEPAETWWQKIFPTLTLQTAPAYGFSALLLMTLIAGGAYSFRLSHAPPSTRETFTVSAPLLVPPLELETNSPGELPSYLNGSGLQVERVSAPLEVR